MATYTFTEHPGATIGTTTVTAGGTVYNVVDLLRAGLWRIVTSDDVLGAALTALTTGGSPLLDLNGISTTPSSPAALAPTVAAGLSQILAFGNSFGEGGTLSPNGLDRTSRFIMQAAQILGCAEVNYSKDGAVLYQHSDTAGWRATLRRVKPLKGDGVTLRDPQEAGEWTGPAGGECVVLCRNFNDQLSLGATNQDIFIEALRSEVCRMRQCAWYGVDATGWTFSAPVSTQQADAGTTDGPYRALNTGYAERSLPAHFPGGWIDILTPMGNTIGCNYTFSIDGVVALTTAFPTKYAALATYVFPVTKRVFVPAGAHTIRVTGVDNAGGSFNAFMGIGVEAPHPGLVVPICAHRILPAGASIWGANSDPTITIAQTALIKAMASEFTDGLVQPFDMDLSINQDLNLVCLNDYLHPADRGGAVLGADLATWIAQHLPKRRRKKPDRWLNIGDADGFYTGATIGTGVVQAFPTLIVPAGFRRDAEGGIHLRGFLQKTADPGAGVSTVLCTLPVIARPQMTDIFTCFATDGTTRGTCSVQVAADGTVTALPPSAATKHQFGASAYIGLSNITYKAAR